MAGLAGCGASPLRNGRIVFDREAPDGAVMVNGRSMRDVIETVLPTGADRAIVAMPLPERSDQGGAEMMLPLWSPDGQRMSLVSNRGLFIVGADGRKAVSIGPFGESSPEAKDFAWSPHGNSLAFVDNGLLRVVSADGKRGLVIAENSTGQVYNVPLGWSADGKELFFYEHGVKGQFRLYAVELTPEDFGDWSLVMPPAGRRSSAQALPPERRALLAGWSVGRYQGCRVNMAAQQLACLLSGGMKPDPQNSRATIAWDQVKLVAMDSGKVTDFLPEQVNGLPKWSPDGEMAAFATAAGLWTVRTNGWSNPVQVSKPVKDFAWAPDGQWLAVVPQSGKSIFRVRPNGKDLTLVLKSEGRVRSLSWQGLQRKK
jgi:Tol biopolymer transport system component